MARGVNPSENDDKNGMEEDDMNSRRSALRLSLNPLAVPLFGTAPSREDVQEGGQILFQNFVREEIHHNPTVPPDNAPVVEQLIFDAGDDVDVSTFQSTSINHDGPRFRGAEAYAGIRYNTSAGSRARTPEGYKRFDSTKVGRNIRELADAFARSREGEKVRQQADEVKLQDINEDSFLKLLIELFSDGISVERVIALFYFCTSLIIRAASSKDNLNLTRYLFIWSLRFIKDRVCDWVYRNGGWETVLSKMSKVILTLAVFALTITAIGCGWVYIRKNW